jgi:hypothetical protein
VAGDVWLSHRGEPMRAGASSMLLLSAHDSSNLEKETSHEGQNRVSDQSLSGQERQGIGAGRSRFAFCC